MKALTAQLEEDDDRADLTPMIDCVFLLLMFFILTATFVEDTFFPIEMPQAKRASLRTPADAAVLEVTTKGEMAINRKYMRSKRVSYMTLAKMKKQKKLKTLIIKADKSTPYEHIAWVMDAMQALNIQEFSFAVRGPN